MINELHSMTTFVRTVELGSLSKAADAQQISPQAASKALKQLETHLGGEVVPPYHAKYVINGGGTTFL
ncbi:LysR family transcriptional regulator [Salmonella bongori]|nr:LysR family transcriptional regulator [Salmonella bongori]